MKKYIIATIGILILLYLIISAIINMDKIDKSIADNKYETIGKVTKFYSNRSSSRYYFIYYYKGRKYNESNLIDYADRDSCVDKYYKIELSTENPNYAKIFLNQEITDSTEIKRFGQAKKENYFE